MLTYEDACPYCGEGISLIVDQSEPEQQYVEDCFVCCRPILIAVREGENGVPAVSLWHENEVPNP